MTDLPFTYGDAAPANPAAPQPRKCRRHEWAPTAGGIGPHTCLRCNKTCDQVEVEAARRRGRTNRSRGNAIERWVCKVLGIARRGQYGGPDDGGDSSDWITVQVKSGGAYPERIDGLLRALPIRADQLRAVVHTDAPGAGHARRALITLDLGEFSQWYGKGSPE